MFGDFSTTGDADATRRLALSTGASFALYALVGAAIVAAGATATPEVKKRVEVVFRPPPAPVEIAPEPAPPPKPIARPPPPKTLKTVEVANLPPPSPLVEPQEMPQEKPAEAEPTGDAIPVPAAPRGGFSYKTPATTTSSSEPIHLPENAQPPSALSSNAQPEYPDAARARSQEGQVILRIVVDANGDVTRVEVLRGEEPFVSAAVAAVRRWKYRPALLEGTPVAAYRVVKVPFRLRDG